jgi:preprotein translocase subunit SecA
MAIKLKQGLGRILKKLSNKTDRDMKRYGPLIDQINAHVEAYQALDEAALRGKTDEFRQRLDAGETLDDLLAEAFAVVKEACRRNLGRRWDVTGHPKEWDMVPFDVQLIGGIVLHEGKIAEMATGEGKTLVAILPLYLNGLSGHGAHLITVNDYLARRDAAWVGGILEYLGLTVGCIQGMVTDPETGQMRSMNPEEKRDHYGRDVTYGTNNEFGFDYLRDNMAVRADHRVQRPHNFAIVDEVDSVLIDEARTPLIISGPAQHSIQQYGEMKPHVEKITRLQAQRMQDLLTEAEELLQKWTDEDDNNARYRAGERLLQVTRGAPKHKKLAKLIADEPGLSKLIQEVESDYMRDKSLHKLDDELYFAIDEKGHSVNISDEAQRVTDRGVFRVPELSERLDWIDRIADLAEAERTAMRAELFEHTVDVLILGRNRSAQRDPEVRGQVRALIDEFVQDFGSRVGGKPMSELQIEAETMNLRELVAGKVNEVVPQGQRSESIEDEAEDILFDFAWKLNLLVRPIPLDHRAAVKEIVYRDYSVRAERIHNVQTLLKAYTLYEKDVEYVIQDNRIVIVDQNTGRLMPGRRFGDGLHQALEAKEGVTIQGETQTLATITIQNYFRMYQKLAGMTGTAETESAEFWDIYGLDVVVIPTNQPIARVDQNDLIYKTRREKYNAVVDEVKRLHELRLPVLVGTVSVEVSETLSRLLTRAGIKHNVLNAKHHQKEAEIVADAGRSGAVTIATNMAGRGTDIKLAPDIGHTTFDEHGTPGGLQVIGTERHEARRIDRQLRGRSGRQGDPGASQFFISLEDNLMRLFAPERISSMMDKLGAPEGEPLAHPMLNKSIERAQKRVEARNFEIRKHLLEYDNVMNQQREIIYERRNAVLEGEDISSEVQEMLEELVTDRIDGHLPEGMPLDEVDWKPFFSELELFFLTPLKPDDFAAAIEEGVDALTVATLDAVRASYARREAEYGESIMREVERHVILRTIDEKWRDHLYEVDRLKEGIGWASVGGKDPLLQYKKDAYEYFVALNLQIRDEVVKRLFRVQIQVDGQTPAPEAPQGQAMRGGEVGQIPEGTPESQGGSAEEIAARKEAIARQRRQMAEMARRAQQVRTQRAVNAVVGSEGPEATPHGGDGRMTAQKPAVGALGAPAAAPVAAPSTAAPKVGRNDPCPCGSGKKYKKCHGASA